MSCKVEGMKEISSFRPTIQSVAGEQYAGRSGRRALGDIAAKKGNPAPVKSFQGNLASSKVGLTQQVLSKNETVARPTSNDSILSAIGAKSAATRQNSAADGIGRTPPTPPRSPSPPVQTTPVPGPTAPVKINSMQQSWLDSNTGSYANLMMHNLSRSTPFAIDNVDIRWANGSSGKPEFVPRAVGNVSAESGKQLAQLMGGTLVNGPFETFGTSQRDQYIKMPSGQMIEASVLASQLNAARGASDPFSATQSVLEIYRLESQNFNMASSNNAIDLVSKGSLRAGWPSNQAT